MKVWEGELVVGTAGLWFSLYLFIFVCACVHIYALALVGPMFLNKVLCVYAFVDIDDFDYIYRPN